MATYGESLAYFVSSLSDPIPWNNPSVISRQDPNDHFPRLICPPLRKPLIQPDCGDSTPSKGLILYFNPISAGRTGEEQLTSGEDDQLLGSWVFEPARHFF